MALFLNDDGHYDLQQYFLKWAPGIPPLHIRKRLLGFIDTDNSDSDSDSDTDDWSLVVSMAGVALDSESNATEDADTSYTGDNDAAASPLGSEVIDTTSGALFRGRSQELWLPGEDSIWEWSSADEMSAATHARVSMVNNNAQGERYFLEHTFIQSLGGYQPEAPGTIPDVVVASIDDALRCIQDVKSYKEIGLAIDAVSTWAATASTTELKDFNESCEVFPYAMWVRVSSSGTE